MTTQTATPLCPKCQLDQHVQHQYDYMTSTGIVRVCQCPTCNGLWAVYDSCAEWCAKRGLKGKIGDPLPNLLDSRVVKLINDDPEAFEQRVRDTAYALAIEKHGDS